LIRYPKKKPNYYPNVQEPSNPNPDDKTILKNQTIRKQGNLQIFKSYFEKPERLASDKMIVPVKTPGLFFIFEGIVIHDKNN